MRFAVIGSRDFQDYNRLKRVLNKIVLNFDDPHIVSGGCRGADVLAVQWAKENNIGYTEYLPEWDKYGKSAGFKRNKDIINNSDFVIAFWNGSNGTKNSLDLAREQKKPTLIIYF